MGEHIAVEMMVARLKGLGKCVVGILADTTVFIICAVVTWEGILLVIKMVEMKSVSPVLHISMAYCYAAVPVGCGLMMLREIESVMKRIQEYRNPPESAKGVAEA